MTQFAIIDSEPGLTVVSVPPGESAEEAALREGGLLVDAGPFDNYDDAYDAMLAIPDPEVEQKPD